MKKASMKNVFDFRNFQLASKSKRNIIGGIDPNRPSNLYNELPLDDDLGLDPSDPDWAGPGSGTTSSSTSFSTATNENSNPIIPLPTSSN